jgi:hypothetical protein
MMECLDSYLPDLRYVVTFVAHLRDSRHGCP